MAYRQPVKFELKKCPNKEVSRGKSTAEQAAATKVLAANQGLYNGFIAAGLLWGLMQGAAGYDFKVYFLLCVIVAGVFGAVTVNRKILYIQALPGLLALLFVFISK